MLAEIMNPVDGFFPIRPEDLSWRRSNIMKIPNADFLDVNCRSRFPSLELLQSS